MRIAIYSGSFNPIHLGHTALAGFLTENNLVDEVWFVVSPCNPLKEQKDLLDEYLRLDMLMLAIQGNPRFKASDIEFTNSANCFAGTVIFPSDLTSEPIHVLTLNSKSVVFISNLPLTVSKATLLRIGKPGLLFTILLTMFIYLENVS